MSASQSGSEDRGREYAELYVDAEDDFDEEDAVDADFEPADDDEDEDEDEGDEGEGLMGDIFDEDEEFHGRSPV